MVPEDNKELLQFDNMRKQLKTQSQQIKIIPQDLYPERQRKILAKFLLSLKDYPKITAVMIEHQHKSISTLKSQIKDMLPEFKERVGRSIQCCKKNAEFLERLRVGLETALGLGDQRKYQHHQQQHEHQHEHSHQPKQQQPPSCQHSHSHPTNPIKLINIFHHLCRQYSQQSIHKQQQFYIEFVKTTIREYINQHRDDENSKGVKTLVVGSGMGRCLVEIRRVYEEDEKERGGENKFEERVVQGHQEDAEQYLLAEYLLNHHHSSSTAPQSISPTQSLSLHSRIQIYPYIHNFSNHLDQQTPYKSVTINLPQNIKSSNPYPMTFGQFNKLYKSHSQQWNIIVTQFYNYSITDVLLHVQVIYKLLRDNGMWVDISTSSFQNHIIPYLSYQQYEKILDKSQFQLVNKFNRKQLWYQQPNKIMSEWRRVYYRVMMKKKLVNTQ